jgi:cytidylate kinase
LKIYLDASPEERARRRWREELARGIQPTYEEVLADVRRRDQIDSTRKVAPLRPAGDAVLLDSTAMSVDDVVTAILARAGAHSF